MGVDYVADERDDPSLWKERSERLRATWMLAQGKDLPPWKRVNASLFLLALAALACMVIEEGMSWRVVAKAAQTDRVEWDGLLLLWHVILATLPLTTWACLWMFFCLLLGSFPFLTFVFLGPASLYIATTLAYWLGFPHAHNRFTRPSIWITFTDGPKYLIINLHYYGLGLFIMSLLCGLILGVIGHAWASGRSPAH